MPLTSAPCARRPRTGTTTSTPTSAISATSSTWTRSAAPKLRIGVDPLGGAGVHYWAADRRALRARPHRRQRRGRSDLPLHDASTGTARSAWICSSPYAMARPDRPQGPLRRRLRLRHRPRPPRHRHAQRRPAAAESLSGGGHRLPFQHRPRLARGRRRRQDRGQQQHDRPRGGEARPPARTRCRSASSGSSTACSTARSASAARRARAPSFLRRDGTVWTTDKDGIMPACWRPRSRRAPAAIPARSTASSRAQFGDAGLRAHRRAGHAGAEDSCCAALAGAGQRPRSWPARRSQAMLTRAPGNDAAIGGLKVIAENGWFAARPVGHRGRLQDLRRELRDTAHLRQIQEAAQGIVSAALT